MYVCIVTSLSLLNTDDLNNTIKTSNCMYVCNLDGLLVQPSDDHFAAVLLQQLSEIFHSMSGEKQADVCKRVMFSGALPIARDTASYAAIVAVLDGIHIHTYIYFQTSDIHGSARRRYQCFRPDRLEDFSTM